LPTCVGQAKSLYTAVPLPAALLSAPITCKFSSPFGPVSSASTPACLSCKTEERGKGQKGENRRGERKGKRKRDDKRGPFKLKFLDTPLPQKKEGPNPVPIVRTHCACPGK